MDDFKIEINVPISEGRGDTLSYALRQLCQAPDGASILFNGKNYGSMRTLATKISAEQGVKFTVRKISGGVRVWKLP
jgi:hypothetical protein